MALYNSPYLKNYGFGTHCTFTAAFPPSQFWIRGVSVADTSIIPETREERRKQKMGKREKRGGEEKMAKKKRWNLEHKNKITT